MCLFKHIQTFLCINLVAKIYSGFKTNFKLELSVWSNYMKLVELVIIVHFHVWDTKYDGIIYNYL